MNPFFLQTRASLIIVSFGVFVIATDSLRAEEADVHPLQQRAQWLFEDPAAWEWNGEVNAITLVLKQPSQYKPKVRRPFNLAWLDGSEWASFTLTGELRLDSFNKGNNDLCVAFGGQGESEFYYAHLGESADAAHLQLHIVNNADRKSITKDRAKNIPWQPNHWHHLKLERDTTSGSIKVWFDDQLVLQADDLTFGKGRIGLGSFDDLGAFRNVVIKPESAAVDDSRVRRIEASPTQSR